jgi:serine/threonine-protein kinase
MTHPPVDPEGRRAIDDLFDGALDQPPDQRAAWLTAHCDDPVLRHEVEALLAAADSTDALLDRNALDVAGDLLASLRLERVGPYRILRELGRGGMGVVYLAERADGQFRRRVAVKVLRSSPDPAELHRRFLGERQILASLNHPNIAQFLDGGVTETQLPYLVMEYVDGVPLTTYCDRQRLSIEERLRLFHDVCAAVQHAHQNLVIHRDLKPSNILVTVEGRVKLLDFGIAKLLNPVLGPADQPLTQTEWRVLTPEYASPEQIRGDALTTASDVYALGVLLYELLSGRRPHRITGGSPHELAERIVARDPRLPSVAVRRPDSSGGAAPVAGAATGTPGAGAGEATPEAVAAERGLSVERLERRLTGDLDAIVMMALRKESARRYGSAEVLWEDVQRHLDGLPVLAHHATRWYRARKFLGRHRAQAVLAAVLGVALVSAATIAVRQAAVARRERDRAEAALGQSREVTDFLVRLFRTPAPPGATRDQVTVTELLATGTARVEELGGQPLVQAQMLDALGRVNEQLGRFDDAERMLRRALALRRARLGDNNADVAATLNHLSSVVRQRDRGEEAIALAREALAIQRRVLGPRHPEVAVTLLDVAALTSNKAAAESLYRTALAIQLAAFGSEQLDVATTKYWLATILRNRGASAEAETLLRESLAIRERLLGSEHPLVVTSMIYLGNHLQSYSNRPVEAESVYNRALTILRKQPSAGLRPLATVLTSLSSLYDKRGDYARSETFAREALDVQRRLLGVDHPLITEYMALVARPLAGQGRNEEAEAMLRDAVAVIERTLGPDHPRVAELLTPLADVRLAMGRRREAESDLRRALALVDRSEGRERSVAAISAKLAELVALRGDTVESKTLFDRADTIFRGLPPQIGPDMLAAYAALADHYKATSQPAEEAYFRRLASPR